MKRKNISSIKFINFIITLSSLILYYILFLNTDSFYSQESMIFMLSWIGVIEIIYIISTWGLLTGKYVTLYTLFMIFFFIFNYGQPILWAFGIHLDTEIGATNLYYTLSVPSNNDIIQTQLIVLISGLMIHFGAILFKKQALKKEKVPLPEIPSDVSQQQFTLFKFVLFISPIVFFAKFYDLLTTYNNAQQFGYTALYYSDDVVSANVIILIIARLFVPVLLGMLIGSGYNPKIVRIVYIIFGLNIIISILIGDRGSWIYALIIFIICHHYYYKKLRFKQFSYISILFLAVAYISSAIVSVRNTGVSFEKIINVLSELETNPIIANIFVMGGTMGITTTLVMNGWNIFPYGDTFIYGLLTAATSDTIDWLNLDYETLGSWFSQGYLGISNGAGFSIVGEILINYGPYFLPIFMILFGVIIYWITDIEYRNLNTETYRIIFNLITTLVIINISRNVFSYNAGEVIYTTGQFFAYFIIYKYLFSKKFRR